jgi:hypothetical protein
MNLLSGSKVSAFDARGARKVASSAPAAAARNRIIVTAAAAPVGTLVFSNVSMCVWNYENDCDWCRGENLSRK